MKIHRLNILAIASVFLACAGSAPVVKEQPKQKIHMRTIEMPSHSWDAFSLVDLDISAFPDSVTFFLPIGKERREIGTASLLDDVFGWQDRCDFNYREYGVPYGSNIIIVEDISASMGDYLGFTEKLIWGFVSTLLESGCDVSLVRFGESSDVTIGWVQPDSFLNLPPDKLPYPNDRGTDLSGALEKALDLAALRSNSTCSIVLFSDGDFMSNRLPNTLIERAKRNGISINVLLHGKNPKGALADISRETGGIYFTQPEDGFSAQLVSAIIAQSFFIAFFPKHTDKDGALHRISVVFDDGRRFTGEFRAPGDIPVRELDPAEAAFSMPEGLLQTVIIPFDSAGNNRLLENAEEILKEYLREIEKLPDTLAFSLKIAGYACNLGSTGINIRLSKQRAEVVRDYVTPLLRDNFELQLAWHGELFPLNENRDELERRANRRVEITVEQVASGAR